MARKQKAQEEGASWMDTYGDMVTLLLCFFVLLYSISTIDQLKWELIVKSFNPNAEKVSQIVVDKEQNEEGVEVEGAAEVDLEDFEDLYYMLQEAIQENNLEGEVELNKGEGYTFITFRDNVFFNPESALITEDGEHILDLFIQCLNDVSESIGEIQVLGHTSQGNPELPNNPVTDRVLSSERAARVTAYIHEHSQIDPAKMISTGYGQHRPIASFDTAEDRAKNRRVEILITRNDAVVQSLDKYYDEVYGDDEAGADAGTGTDEGTVAGDGAGADTAADGETGTNADTGGNADTATE